MCRCLTQKKRRKKKKTISMTLTMNTLLLNWRVNATNDAREVMHVNFNAIRKSQFPILLTLTAMDVRLCVCVCDMITMQFLFSILFILYLFPFSICNLLPQKLIWNELNFKVFAIIYSLPLYCIYCVHSHAHTLLFEQPLAENSVGEESIFRLMWLCNNFQFRPITKPFVF